MSGGVPEACGAGGGGAAVTEAAGGAWVQQGPYFWEGPGQCRVSACRTVAGWRFSAWSALAMPTSSYWDWAKAQVFAETYGVGVGMPQRRTYLGVFRTAEEARAACLAWLATLGGVELLAAGVEGATGRSGAGRVVEEVR